MESVLNISPGLMIWTLFNFFILLFLIIKFAVKPIVKAIRSREESIRLSIENAQKANLESQQILQESKEKLRNAQNEMAEIIQKGRQQSEELIKKATDEAERVKRTKINEAAAEIERSKNLAIAELRNEVADLVVQATSKLLGEIVDKEKHQQIIQSHIDKLQKN